MGATQLAPPGKDGPVEASSARKPKQAKLKDWTSTIICTCGCLYIISCSPWLLASSGLLGSLVVFAIGCLVATIVCMLALVWVLYKTADKFDPARERELRLQQLGLTCKAARAAAASHSAGSTGSTSAATGPNTGRAGRGKRQRGQQHAGGKGRGDASVPQQDGLGGMGCTVVEGKVVLGPQAQLPPTKLLPADAVRPQPRTSATGTYSGVIWTVPGSTWQRAQRANPFPPICEGPKATSHRWHATLSEGKLTLYPAYGAAWQGPNSSNTPQPAAGKPRAGGSAASKAPDIPQLPAVVEVPLQGCEAVVVQECLQGGTPWAKNAPIEIRLKFAPQPAASSDRPSQVQPVNQLDNAADELQHGLAMQSHAGMEQLSHNQDSGDINQGVQAPGMTDGSSTETVPHQLLYGESSFFFFAENGVAKEQWALALQAAYGPPDKATAIGTARAMYASFCEALRGVAQVALPNAAAQPQQGNAATDKGQTAEVLSAKAHGSFSKQGTAKQAAPPRTRAAQGPGPGGFGWFRGLFNRRGRQQPGSLSNKTQSKEQLQQQEHPVHRSETAPAGTSGEAEVQQQGHHQKADSHPLLALPSFMSSRTMSYAADRVVSELQAVKALQQDGFLQQQQLEAEAGTAVDVSQVVTQAGVSTPAVKPARGQRGYGNMPGIPETGDTSPTHTQLQEPEPGQVTQLQEPERGQVTQQHVDQSDAGVTRAVRAIDEQLMECPDNAAAGSSSHDAVIQDASASTSKHATAIALPASPFQVAAEAQASAPCQGSNLPGERTSAAGHMGADADGGYKPDSTPSVSPAQPSFVGESPTTSLPQQEQQQQQQRSHGLLATRMNSVSVPNLLALNATAGDVQHPPPQSNPTASNNDSNGQPVYGGSASAVASPTTNQHQDVGEQHKGPQLKRRHSLDQGTAAAGTSSTPFAWSTKGTHESDMAASTAGTNAAQASNASPSPEPTKTQPHGLFTYSPPAPTTGALVDGLHGLNMLLVRLMYEFLRAPWFSRRLQLEIQKLLSKLKLPPYLQPLVLEHLDLGTSVPLVKAVRAVAGPANASTAGGLWPQIAVDLVYTGRVAITTGTKVELQKAGLFNQLQTTLARLQGGTGPHEMHSPLGTSPSGSVAGDSPPNGLSPASSCASLTALMEAVGQDDATTPTHTDSQPNRLTTNLSATASAGAADKATQDSQQGLGARGLQQGLAASCPALKGVSEAISSASKAGAVDSGASLSPHHPDHNHHHHHTRHTHTEIGGGVAHMDSTVSAGSSQGHKTTSSQGANQGGGFLGLGALTRAAAATAQQLSQQLVESLARMPVQLMLECVQFEATMLVWLSPPPSDRLWLSFQEAPRMTLSVRPVLGGRVLRYRALLGHVSGLITAKITRALYREMVFPACVDVKLGFFASPETASLQLPLDVPLNTAPFTQGVAKQPTPPASTITASQTTPHAASSPALVADVNAGQAKSSTSTWTATGGSKLAAGSASDVASSAVAVPRPGLSANLSESAAAAVALAGTAQGDMVPGHASTSLASTTSGTSSKLVPTASQGTAQPRRGLFLGFRWRPWGQRSAGSAAAQAGAGIPHAVSSGSLRPSRLSSTSLAASAPPSAPSPQPDGSLPKDAPTPPPAPSPQQDGASPKTDPTPFTAGITEHKPDEFDLQAVALPVVLAGLTAPEDAAPPQADAASSGPASAQDTHTSAGGQEASDSTTGAASAMQQAGPNAAGRTIVTESAVLADASVHSATGGSTASGAVCTPAAPTDMAVAASDGHPEVLNGLPAIQPVSVGGTGPGEPAGPHTPRAPLPRGQRARQVVHGAAVVAGQSWRGVTWLGGAIGRAVRGRHHNSTSGPNSASTSSPVSTPKASTSQPAAHAPSNTAGDAMSKEQPSAASMGAEQQACMTSPAVAESLQPAGSAVQSALAGVPTGLTEVESFPCNVSSFASGTSGMSTTSIRINPSFLVATATANAAKLRNSITRRSSNAGAIAPCVDAAAAASSLGDAASTSNGDVLAVDDSKESLPAVANCQQARHAASEHSSSEQLPEPPPTSPSKPSQKLSQLSLQPPPTSPSKPSQLSQLSLQPPPTSPSKPSQLSQLSQQPPPTSPPKLSNALAFRASVRLSPGSQTSTSSSIPGSNISPDQRAAYALRSTQSVLASPQGDVNRLRLDSTAEAAARVASSPPLCSVFGGGLGSPKATAAHLVPLPCGSMRRANQSRRHTVGTSPVKALLLDGDLLGLCEAPEGPGMKSQPRLSLAQRSVSACGAVAHAVGGGEGGADVRELAQRMHSDSIIAEYAMDSLLQALPTEPSAGSMAMTVATPDGVSDQTAADSAAEPTMADVTTSQPW